MDVKIKDKDITTKACGDAVYISGFDEIIQRIKIASTIRKGSFVYDKNFGRCDFDTEEDELVCQKLEMILKEATIGIGYDDLSVLSYDPDTKKAVVIVSCCSKTDTVEVTING